MDTQPFGNVVNKREIQDNRRKMIVAHNTDTTGAEKDEVIKIGPIELVAPIASIEPIKPIESVGQ